MLGAEEALDIPGIEGLQRIRRLGRELRRSDGTYSQVLEELTKNPDLPPETRYFFPRLDGAEMWSRWDMQDAPPDILITNYAMLNIMLMRTLEENILKDIFNQSEANNCDLIFDLHIDVIR